MVRHNQHKYTIFNANYRVLAYNVQSPKLQYKVTDLASPWEVWRNNSLLEYFPTHGQAVEYVSALIGK